MSPPELAADTPVFDVLEPVAVRVFVFRRIENDVVVHYRREGDVCKMLHLDEPLEAQTRLDRHVRTLRITDFVVVVLDFLNEVERFEVFDDLLTAIETIHAVVLAYVRLEFRLDGVHVQMGIRREDVDSLEVVFLPQGIVVDVVCRRHFEAACSETNLHVAVFDDGDDTTDTRYDDVLAFEPLVLLLFGVDADRYIAEDGLRTGSCHDGIFARLFSYLVAQVIELVMLVVVDHLLVGKGSLTLRVPVHHTQTAVDETFLIEVTEDVNNGFGTGLVHGEGRAVPIT